MSATIKVPEKIAQEMYIMSVEGYKQTEIATKFGCSVATVSKYVRKLTPSPTICPSCRAKDNPLDSKFCRKCGTQLKTEHEIIADKLEAMIATLNGSIPETIRDEFRDLMNHASKLLRGKRG